MKKYLPVLIALLILSCNHTGGGYRLPPTVMTHMLTDLHVAEVYSTIVKKDVTARGFDKNMDSLAIYYKEIFAHYNVSQQQFDQSLQWYKLHPDELDTVYSKIIPELGKYDK